MTFSIVARCARTRALGVGIASRSYAVAARCAFVRAGVGAVVTQATTDPRLGKLALDFLGSGQGAQQVLDSIRAADRNGAHHQLGIVDRDGGQGAETGSLNVAWAGHRGTRNAVALGNHLTSERTVIAMLDSFEATLGLDLDERLLRAIESGRDAGGQVGGQRAAGLIVYEGEDFPLVDLRVDAHDEPISELRRLLGLFAPLKRYFTERANDPTLAAPADA